MAEAARAGGAAGERGAGGAAGERGAGESDMQAVFAASGELGQDLLLVDWEATPLGAPNTWPQSLKTVVRMVLTSRFAMWMAWGPDLTFFFNETYRRDTLGSKYPWALAQSARDVWAEIWSDIGPRIESVMGTGVASWDESLLLFLERSGYREETYHTFSYSPLTDDDGQVAGMLCVVSEDTDRVINERRMTTLRDLGGGLTSARTEDDVFAVVERRLGSDLHAIPFSLVYRFEAETFDARLVSAAGADRGHPVAPLLVEEADPTGVWPLGEVSRGRSVVVDLEGDRFPVVPAGAWDEPPQQALVVPLLARTEDRPYGFLVSGLNRYRPFDAGYEGFLSLVASQIAASIANARAYDAERRRAETLAELDRAKTTFFTNVSHEFRTPLTLLLGPAHDALHDADVPLPPEQRTRIELIDRNGQRLLKLVNSLLDFSRLESGRIEPRFEPVDLPLYTLELVSMFGSAADRAGLTLDVDCAPLDEPVYVDREMWAKIVSNLLSNALKFTFTGGIAIRLARTTRDQAASIQLEVRDTGIGIEPADQVHLFERFHRVVGARSRTHEGSGIGLALVAELAKMHGGGVTARSEVGSGSTFTVHIPLGSAHLETHQIVQETTGDLISAEHYTTGFVEEAMRWLEQTEGVGGGDRRAVGSDGAAEPVDRPTVLVVDDNADMRRYISSLLGDDYTVELAPDGAVALEMALSSVPDLVLTDVMMPNLDGYGLLAALRADARTSQVPIVMLSAQAGEEAAVAGLDAGADDYLVKPFTALELTARVRSSIELERARREAGRDRALLAEVELSRERLDQAQHLARVGSWEVDLVSEEVSGSDEFLRMLELDAVALQHTDIDRILARFVHPQDLPGAVAAIAAGSVGDPIAYECRLIRADGAERVVDVRGEAVRDPRGQITRLRGSIQDITDQRSTERALAAAALAQETARHEHRIAEDLQRSLVPAGSVTSDHLQVSTYYQPGEQGTQVGGDWFDVIELGAGRTALVIGDVMGRGLRAAAVMGQLRSAVRAYARLDLPPADVLEYMDGMVRDLDGGQIVTCVFAVYDPADQMLVYTNAGHLPPVVCSPGEPAHRLTEALGPPLGVGSGRLSEERVHLANGATVVLYTDGLVEQYDNDLDSGIDAIAAHLDALQRPVDELTATLVDDLRPNGADDDVAVLVARVPEVSRQWASAAFEIKAEGDAVATVRRRTEETLRSWEVPDATVDDVVLLASELATNAIIHGRPPIQLRLRRTTSDVLLEVIDSANFLPRKLRPTPDDEHGRGLQIVAILAERWGVRATDNGKSIWCITSIRGADPEVVPDRSLAH